MLASFTNKKSAQTFLIFFTFMSFNCFAQEKNLICKGKEGFPFNENTAKPAMYELLISPEKLVATIKNEEYAPYTFPLYVSGGDHYADDVTTIGPGKPDLEFYLNRYNLSIWYNRGFSNGDRVIFSGKCQIKPNPLI